MADGEKASGTGTSSNPESPTTARPLDFDDEPQETGVTPAATPTANRSLPPLEAGNEDAPPKPPRPLTPQQQAQKELKEAFPSIEDGVIKAVLVASGGNMERAFHALLGMTDPNAQDDVSAKPPLRDTNTSTSQRQLEADELYARQLAEHYSGAAQSRGHPHSDPDREPHLPKTRRETGLKPNELYDDEDHSFFEDDLPVIKESIRQGFLETQAKVNTWVQNFKKSLDGEESEDEERYQHGRPRHGYNNQSFGETSSFGARHSTEARRSADRERYDADPPILSDNFSSLELRDNEAPPPQPPRPQAKQDLPRTKSQLSDQRKVSFQDGPPEEIGNPYSGETGTKNRGESGAKPSKWQPLSAVDPSPINDNDPFSVGDSDDEKEAKNKDMKPEEAERVKKATEEAMSGEIGSDSKPEEKAQEKPTDTK